MKKTLFIILLSVILLLCACADVSVSYSLGDSDETDIEYTLDIKSIELDARNFADSVSDYWNSLGFDTDISIESESVTVSGHKAVLYDDRQAAADSFSKALCGQESVFTSVDFSYSPSFEEDLYSFNAVASLEDIIRQSELQDIPQSELEALFTMANQGEYTLSVSLPGEITETNADLVDGGVCTWKLDYGSQKQVSLSTRLDNTANLDEYADVTEKLSSAGMLFRLMIASASLIVFVVIVLLIVRGVKKSRNQKSAK